MMTKVFALLLVFFAVSRGGIVQKVIHCSSWHYKPAHCKVPDLGVWTKLSVIENQSKVKCDHRRTFGLQKHGILVIRGCRAIFQVLSCTKHKIQYCESKNGKFNTCTIAKDAKVQVHHVEVDRQLTKCSSDKFGIDGNKIWVNDGCRAKFHVCY